MSAEGFGVVCGQCGGPVYMETCETQRGQTGHYDVLGSECKRCGLRNDSPTLRCSICDQGEVR